MSDEVIIGVDLGGTRIRAAACDTQLNILERTETLTRAAEGRDATIERIKKIIRQVFPDDKPVTGIGFSAPGPLNPKTGVVVAPPNLPGWHNVPLGDILQEEFGVPVYVGNDANVAALAETLRGAARGHNNVVFITVSTGIGSGIISGGYMILGYEGLGAEIGHIPIIVGEHVSTLEEEAAGPAIAEKVRRRIEAGEASLVRDLVNGNMDNIEGSTVGDAAIAGDKVALEVVKEAGKTLGLGLVTMLHLFNPEVIVIGGGVANGLGDILLTPARKAIQSYAIDKAYWEHLKIVTPDLPEDLSIIGAAALVVTHGGVERIDEVAKHLGLK
jgi:glucokinase